MSARVSGSAMCLALAWACTASGCLLVDRGWITRGDDSSETGRPEDTDSPGASDLTPSWNTGAWRSSWWDAIDCSDPERVTLFARTSNWGLAAHYYITETRFVSGRAWDENGTFVGSNDGFNEDGSRRTTFLRTLEARGMIPTTPDVDTVWTCQGTPSINPRATDDFGVAIAIAVWGPGDDRAWDPPADCLVFGYAPEALIDDPSSDGRSPPSWLRSTNCRVVD